MNRYLFLLPLLFLSFLVSCEDDGEYSPPRKDGDDTTYVVSEPSDGSIEAGVSGTKPFFMSEDVAGHRLSMGMVEQAGIYALDQIGAIELTFTATNWEEQLRAMADGDNELHAVLSYEGYELPAKVGVRIKGSLTNPQAKPSYYVAIDAKDKNQLLNGYYTLALNSIEDDTTCLREAIYRQCIRRYIPAPQVNFVNVRINGVDQGLYINTEHLNASFINEWFVSTNGSRWRAEPTKNADPAKVGAYGTGYSGLNYLGETAADYASYYDLKNNPSLVEPLDDLIAVCRILEKTNPDSLEAAIKKELDLDRTLWFLACENIFTDEDGYVKKGGTDYYLFWNKETGLLTPLEYDGKDTFHGENIGWDPFYHADDTRYPLLNKLLAVPAIRQRYLAHYRTILNEVYNPEYLNPLIDHLVAKIDSAVAADPRRTYAHSAFTASVAAMKQTITQRSAFLNTHDSIKVSGMTISAVEWEVDGLAWKQPVSTDTVKVTATIGGTGHVNSVFLCAGTGMFGGFRRLQMFDTGDHGDRIAGDGIFTALINPQQPGVRVRFYIEAVRGNAVRTRTYMPAGAEHDVYTYVVQ